MNFIANVLFDEQGDRVCKPARDYDDVQNCIFVVDISLPAIMLLVEEVIKGALTKFLWYQNQTSVKHNTKQTCIQIVSPKAQI